MLCRPCALDVAPCDGLIADHVRSTFDGRGLPPAGSAAEGQRGSINVTLARAWLVDGFGQAHPIGATCRIGRSQDCDLVLLASSVSRLHAELNATETGWVVRDAGSRNGTAVDGVRCQGFTPVIDRGAAKRALLKIGDVALWFLTEVVQPPASAAAMATGGGADLVRYQLRHGALELCLVGGGDPAAGGALLSRAVGTAAWAERGLAPLEFQLLRALCIRAHAEASAPSTVRGCVPTKQLARDLPFQSKYANEENVRQVVRRVRGVLGELGGDGVLAAAPGRGYYVTGEVTIAGAPAVDPGRP